MFDAQFIQNLVRSNAEYLKYNAEILDIFDGRLGKYIMQDLRNQMREQTYLQIVNRLAPINVLPKVVDKLTNIYQTTVIRETENESDEELMGWYVEQLDLNSVMNCSNEMYNLAGNTLLKPYVYEGKPHLSVVQPGKFLLYSNNPVMPYKPTHVILFYKDGDKDFVWVFSKDEMYAMDFNGKILTDKMMQAGMYDAESRLVSSANPIGILPFTYINSSKYSLLPCPDEDGLRIIKLLPVMLSDLNYAAMFQCFSIIYGINIDEEQLAMAPNAFWRFKSDATSDKAPEIGVIKPTVDYTQVLALIESQLSMWLGTKGIRASAIGSLAPDQTASGISKIIDEMDTFEARQKQISIFSNAEKDLWELIRVMHDYWVSTGQIENRATFSSDFKVKTSFAIQLPAQTRGQVVADLKSELESGFISRKRAIAKLNPQMTQEEIEDLMEEIDEERTINEPAEDTSPGPGEFETESEEGTRGPID